MYSQANKIKYVTFEYDQSVVLKSVKIVFSIVKDKKVKVVLTENDQRSKIISFETFDRITDAILKITSKDVIVNSRPSLDGTTIQLDFGSIGNHVSFDVCNLNSDDKDTGLKNFLEVTRMILEIFDVKISEING